MSNYENDEFENDTSEPSSLLKLSIDLKSVENFKISSNLVVQY